MYVPSRDRKNIFIENDFGTFRFNPYRNWHILIGGHFISKSISTGKINFERSIWLWEYDNDEKAMLRAIFDVFKDEWGIQNQKSEQVKVTGYKIKDVLTIGIGIARTDLPALLGRCLINNVAPSDELYSVFMKTKVIDLSNTTSFLFPDDKILYPKSHQAIIKKIPKIKNVKKGPGSSVWNMYDSQQFDEIETRCTQEVREIVQIYGELQKKII